MPQDPPTIVCVGDSALWCTGVRWKDKTPNVLHKQFHGSPIPPVQFRARGGATIGKGTDDYNGYYSFRDYDEPDGTDAWYAVYDSRPDENDLNQNRWSIARDIGSSHPTIFHQLEQFPQRQQGDDREDFELDVPTVHIDQLGGTPESTPPYAEDVDLLVLNGGTNDINLHWLNNPLKADKLDIDLNTGMYCHDHMKELIQAARGRFPEAVICVVGYMPYASNLTDRDAARQFLDEYTAQEMENLNEIVNAINDLGGPDALKLLAEVAIQNVLDFARFQSYQMRRAVAETDYEERQRGDPGVVFVPRQLGLMNAMEASEPWCWGVPPDDDTRDERKPACNHDADSPTIGCRWASIGHPNRQGARHTAQQIKDRYEEYTTAEIGTTALEMASEQPVKVGEVFDRYGLDAQKGLRYCNAHSTIDHIAVTLETGEDSPMVAAVEFIVEPGRNGEGERYNLAATYDPPDLLERAADSDLLDTLGVDAEFGFDHYSKFGSDSTDEMYIDPMHGKLLDPSNIPAMAHETPPLSVGEEWTKKPLELQHVQSMELDVRAGSAWDLREVTIEINGHISTSKSVGTVTGNRVIDIGYPQN